MNKEIIYQHIKNQCMINSWKKSVFGTGDLYSGFMFVGEAAGGDEERLGTPFVGKAGQILNESLSTVGLNRDSFYITNVVKIRPTKINEYGNVINRTPNDDEIKKYLPYLVKEIHLVWPSVIITLGAIALKTMLNDKNASITRFHGSPIKTDRYIFPLYHPASIIYKEDLQEVYNKDMYKLKNFLDSL